MLKLQNISLSFGVRPLLSEVNFQINKGERVCLVGRNGEGKSSLLKVVSGAIDADDGNIIHDPLIKITTLSQEIPENLEATVYEVVASGLEQIGVKLNQYYLLLTKPQTEQTLFELGKIQHELDALDAWGFDQSINEIITRLDLPKDQKVNTLSGGWVRRVLLAKALVIKPDLILLDEPTNHLDIEMIEWLENTLLNAYNGALLFVSHDRSFLNRISTRIIELDRGNLTEYPGNYATYLKRKAIERHNEELENQLFDKRLAEEEVWIRKGVEARRTRNEGRVRTLEKMRRERFERIDRQGIATLHFEESGKSGRKVIEAKNIIYKINERMLIDNFTLTITRGDRIGFIGPNGVGKTTLIRLLLGKIQPQEGMIELGTQLEVAYFDQMRAAIDNEKTVIDNVAEGNDFIDVNGKKRHIISWLQDFMFTPERARSPVSSLSGGERNRLLLAKLFSKPFNLLVLDEPTNDLDVETLELLEELLLDFKGTLLLISHDRTFLDNVVTSLLVFTGEGKIEEHIGGYSEWVEKYKKQGKAELVVKEKFIKPIKRPNNQSNIKKLSYNEKRELEGLPLTISKLEIQITELNELIQTESFYANTHEFQNEKLNELAQRNIELEIAYERWMILESIEQ